MRILVAEPDAHLAGLVARTLSADGFDADVAPSLTGLHEHLGLRVYDTVVLDAGLPGLQLERLWNGHRSDGNGPSLLVTVPGPGACDRVRFLDAGADDCLSKPYELDELAARVRALLRRNGGRALRRLVVGDLVLDPLTRRVRRDGRRIDLTPMEFTLLEFLMRHHGRAVSRAAIAEQVWGGVRRPSTNVIDVVMSRLRKKLDAGRRTQLINPARGVGYFVGPPAD